MKYNPTCVYPDWEGGYYVREHTWQAGWCCICGEKQLEKERE